MAKDKVGDKDNRKCVGNICFDGDGRVIIEVDGGDAKDCPPEALDMLFKVLRSGGETVFRVTNCRIEDDRDGDQGKGRKR